MPGIGHDSGRSAAVTVYWCCAFAGIRTGLPGALVIVVAIVLAILLLQSYACRSAEGLAPDLPYASAPLCVLRGLDHPLPALQRHMMHDRTIAYIRFFEPARRLALDEAGGGEPVQLAHIVRIPQEFRMLGSSLEHPVLHQELDVGDPARVLLDVELPGPRFG